MMDAIKDVETFVVTIPRETPYLGTLLPCETVNAQGYFVRAGNRTIYPIVDRSVLVKVTTASGRVGWGETYGISAPAVVTTLIKEIIGPVVEERDPFDVQVIWEDIYDLMRVRGYHGGFYLDAIAGVDIALWDLCGKMSGLPLCKLLGGQRRDRIPAYVSGLARPTLAERQALAREHVANGFGAIKLHAALTPDAIVAEVGALREAVGSDVSIMLDLHWMFTPADAVALIHRLARYDLAFVEAPCKPEDVAGLAWVADHGGIPVAAGEEWRTIFDARARLEARAVSIVQPEMGHTGVTQFMRIARLAEAHHARVMPHATIGAGIFMAASLHASAAILDLPYHEYQPTIFNRNARLLDGTVTCENGFFSLPTGPGHGVAPNAELWTYAVAG